MNRIKIISYLLIILIIICAINNYINKNSLLIVKKSNIIIEGNQFNKREHIIRLIDNEINNKSIAKISVNKIKQELIKNCYIDSINIIKKSPNYLKIYIKEKKIVAKINNQNKILFIDSNSSIIAPNNNNDKNRIMKYYSPTNIKYSHKINYKSHNQTIDLINIINKNIPYLLTDLDNIIFHDNKIDLSFNENKTLITFSNKDYKNNIKQLIAFLTRIEQTDLNNLSINQYEYINLQINNQIIVKDKKI